MQNDSGNPQAETREDAEVLSDAPASPTMPDSPADISFKEAQQAEKIIRRLRRGNPVRKLARDVMNRRPVSDIETLFTSLGDTARPAQEREIAAWTLGWTLLDTVQQAQATALLRDVLEGEQAPDPRRFQRLAARTLAVGLPLTLVCLLIIQQATFNNYWSIQFEFRDMFAGYEQQSARMFFFWACVQGLVFALLCVAPVSLLQSHRGSSRVRASAAVALGRLQSVDALGALSTALHDHSARVRLAAASALKNILPLLTNLHYGQLGVHVIPNLCRALRQDDELLALHILSALEQVGDGQAMQSVEQMVTNGRTERVRNLAARVLPVLQERRRQEKSSQMLLRASAPLAPGGDMLLRAVVAPSSAPAQEARFVQERSVQEDSAQEAFRPAAPAPARPDTIPDRSRLPLSPAASPQTYTQAEEQTQRLRQGES